MVFDDVDQVLHDRVLNQLTYPMRGLDADMGEGHGLMHGSQEAGGRPEEGAGVLEEVSVGLHKVLGPNLVSQHFVEQDGKLHLDEAFERIHHAAMMKVVDAHNSPERQPHYFTVNGLSFPFSLLNAPIVVRRGELIKVRMLNAGFRPVSVHLHGHEAAITHIDGYKVQSPLVKDTIMIPPAGRADIALRAHKSPGVWPLHDHSNDRATNAGIYPGGMLTAIIYEETELERIPNRLICELVAEVLGQNDGPCSGKSGFSMGPYRELTPEEFPRLPGISRLR